MQRKLALLILSSYLLVCISALIMPFTLIWLRIGLCLIIALLITFFISRHLKKTLEQKEQTIKELKTELQRFYKELQVSSSQISSVSEQLHINLNENNAFAQQVYAETLEMADLNLQVNDNINQTLNGVKNMLVLLEDARDTSEQMGSLNASSDLVIKASIEDIFEIVSTIHEIKESFNGTKVHIKKLSATSGEIVKILESVK